MSKAQSHTHTHILRSVMPEPASVCRLGGGERGDSWCKTTLRKHSASENSDMEWNESCRSRTWKHLRGHATTTATRQGCGASVWARFSDHMSDMFASRSFRLTSVLLPGLDSALELLRLGKPPKTCLISSNWSTTSLFLFSSQHGNLD